MNEYQVIVKAKGFAKEIFGKELNIPITFSGRMTKAFGYFVYNSVNSSVRLQFSKKMLQSSNEDTIDSVILHELAHWYQFENKLPHQDSDFAFKKLVRSVGGSLTGDIKFSGSVNSYKCDNCGMVHTSRRAINTNKYTCKCGGELTKQDNVYIKDTFKRKPGLPENELIIDKYKIKSQIKIVACKVSNKDAEISNLKSYDELKSVKKVTNREMVIFIKEALESNNIDLLKEVKNDYLSIYNSSLKYIGKRRLKKINELLG